MPGADPYGPVGGVTFDGYCEIMAAAAASMYAQGSIGTPPNPADDPYAAEAARRGLDLTSWRRVQLVWGSRCGIDTDLTARMAVAMSAAMGYTIPKPQLPPAPVVDPSDPQLAAIEGVTIESYVRFIRATMVEGAETPEQQAAAASALGFPVDRWEEISSAWGDRVTAGHPVSTRYMQLVSELLG
jgi:hypothetical protein